MTSAPGPARRTNVERTATTRAKILEATMASLVELGYARTSTTEVARRAGVSRGAQLHHFPTKLDLVLAAVEHAIEQQIRAVKLIAEATPEGPDRLDTTIDLLWASMRGPTFAAPFELTAAARTDPDLRPAMAAFGARVDQSFQAASVSLFPRPADAEQQFVGETITRLVFAVLYGLALQSYATDDAGEVNAAAVVVLLKSVVRLFVTAGRVPEVAVMLRALMGETDLDPLRLRELGSAFAAIEGIEGIAEAVHTTEIHDPTDPPDLPGAHP